MVLVVCGMIYLLYNANFLWKDKLIWQIEMLVEQLVACIINLESMSVHSSPELAFCLADFLLWTERFSNPENSLIWKYRPGTNVSGLQIINVVVRSSVAGTMTKFSWRRESSLTTSESQKMDSCLVLTER